MARASIRDDVGYPRAALSGFVAGGCVSILGAALRQVGVPVELERTIGLLFAADRSGTLGVAVVIHLALSAILGMVYAAVMHSMRKRDWYDGVLIAPLHLLVAGALTAIVPCVHPRMPAVIATPGPFLAHGGPSAMAAFAALHLVFGVMFGIMFTTVDPPPVATRRKERVAPRRSTER